MKMKLIQYFIGKNLPHLGRTLLEWLTFGLLMLPIFLPTMQPLDPELVPAADVLNSEVATSEIITAEVVKSDGFTFGDFLAIISGTILYFVTTGISYVRAINPTVGGWVAKIAGRSMESLARRILTAGAVLTTYLGIEVGPEGVSGISMSAIITVILIKVARNIFSAVEDGTKNPSSLTGKPLALKRSPAPRSQRV